IPVIWSLVYSFYDGSPGLNWTFSGLKNYMKLFKDARFHEAFIVNIKYIAITMLGQVVLGLCMALIFKFWLKRFKNVIRTLIFFPVVLPTVAVGQLFVKIYEIQPNYGLLNSLLSNIGLTDWVQPWIGQAKTVLPALSFMDVWVAMGFYAVIFFGALLDIPEDVMEAGKIDGCSAFQSFRYIILPLLKPVTITCLVFSFAGSVKMFESAVALTGGGPGNATTSLSMYMYDVAFSYNKVGYGSTIAIVIFLICIIGTRLIHLLDRKEEE
ncbi:MAG TPA: sugar ABC transporter permease, partial [Candidatus Merdenecus merdavium]|nr:sugar ABC transporter permease [Candidatus Merdenecus merdavium]